MVKLLSFSIFLLAFSTPPRSFGQTGAAKEFLPSAPAGKQWNLIWHDEFEGTNLDETKWERLGDSKRRDGYWVNEDAYRSGHGSLLLRTKNNGKRYARAAGQNAGQVRARLRRASA
jgi:hypothetical protein